MYPENFYCKSIPFEVVKEICFAGGYSTVYCKNAPEVSVVGDWRSRYCSLSDTFRPVLGRLHEFQVRPDDVFVVTSAKCGTTWAQEMLWLIMNDFDFARAKSVELTERSPFLEFNGIATTLPYDTLTAAEQMESPRLLKSHLPAMFLPLQLWTVKPKVVYVFRNPKDALVSYYHHWRGMVGYKGTIEDFATTYMHGHVNFNPFWPHVLDFWRLRDQPNIFFTSYERMKSDLAAVIREVCHFLGKDIGDAQLQQMLRHLSFDNMRTNVACNHIREFAEVRTAVPSGCETSNFRFIRRGIVGSHKDELPPHMIRQCDQWIRDNLAPHKLCVDDFTTYSKYSPTAKQ